MLDRKSEDGVGLISKSNGEEKDTGKLKKEKG